MRVLHLLNELKPSGAEVMLKTAGGLWKGHGVECDIIATGSREGSYAATLRNAGYKVVHAPVERSAWDLYQLGRVIRAMNATVVHVHAERGNFWLAVVARLSGARRIVRTVHNNFPFTGSQRAIRTLQRSILRMLGVVHVAISPGVAATEKTVLRNGTRLVFNWVDSERYVPPTRELRKSARSALGIDDGELVLVSVGNCSALKNHGALIEALDMMGDRLQIRYLHVGLEDVARTEWNRAKSMDGTVRVDFLGAIEDVRGALWAADLFVMPSLREGFSIASLEALATGLPALFADSPGLVDLKEYFPDLVYCSPDKRSLSSAINQIAQRLIALSESARRTYPDICRDRFSASRGVAEYVSIYREVETR